jgi:hypothetical protein
MISFEHDDNLIVVSVYGEFHIADYQQFENEVSLQLRQRGRMNLLIDLRGMLGYTVDVALEEIKFTREHRHDIGRIAILSEQDWVAWLALVTKIFVEADLRVFDDEINARQWLV